jgi:hypothetical protein
MSKRVDCVRDSSSSLHDPLATSKSEEVNGSRRSLATLLGALGVVALGGCTNDPGNVEAEAVDNVAEALRGTGTLKVADTAANLRSLAGGTNLWVAVLQGIEVAGDAGGGLFYWSSTPKQDDGWSVLNAHARSSAGWRRIQLGLMRVDGVTALRALTASTNGSAFLAFHTSPGDGGGGLFIWSETAAPDDDGTAFNAGGLNSSGAGWRRVHSDALNVRWFGARGWTGDPSDTHDDGAAINRALGVAKGKTLYFPPGVYRVTGPLVVLPNTQIKGAGSASTYLYQAGIVISGSGGASTVSNPYAVLALTAPPTGMLLRQNVCIEDICFVGDNGPSPISAQNAGYVFRQTQPDPKAPPVIYVPEGSSANSDWGFSSDVTVRSCRFLSLFGSLFRSDGGGQRMYFNDNQCLYCGGGIYTNDSESQINDNTLDAVWGIQATNQRTQVCRNIIRNAGNSAISVGGDTGYQAYTSDATGAATIGDFGCIVADNVIDAPGGLGIGVTAPLVGAIIARNQISRVSGGFHGIAFYSVAGVPAPSFCKVEDNVIHSVGHIGIWCGQGGYNNVVRRNKVTVNTMAGGGGTPIGIYIGPAPCDGYIVKDNECRGTLADILYSHATNCRVSGNQGTIRIEDGCTFIAEESGTVSFSGTESSKYVPLSLPRVSNQSYRVQLTAAQVDGAPAAGSNRILSVAKVAAGFTVTLETPPVAGSVAFDWTASSDGVH